jgi:hypothetical protein
LGKHGASGYAGFTISDNSTYRAMLLKAVCEKYGKDHRFCVTSLDCNSQNIRCDLEMKLAPNVRKEFLSWMATAEAKQLLRDSYLANLQRDANNQPTTASPLTMSSAIPTKYVALLKEASEMFEATGCVPDADGEPIRADTVVPEAKEYISETIDDPHASYDAAIWDAPGLALVVSWLAQKWNRRCQILAPRRSKNPAQHLTKEQQRACLDSAAAELVHEIKHGQSFH